MVEGGLERFSMASGGERLGVLQFGLFDLERLGGVVQGGLGRPRAAWGGLGQFMQWSACLLAVVVLASVLKAVSGYGNALRHGYDDGCGHVFGCKRSVVSMKL